jgi:hypothetical protein
MLPQQVELMQAFGEVKFQYFPSISESALALIARSLLFRSQCVFLQLPLNSNYLQELLSVLCASFPGIILSPELDVTEEYSLLAFLQKFEFHHLALALTDDISLWTRKVLLEEGRAGVRDRQVIVQRGRREAHQQGQEALQEQGSLQKQAALFHQTRADYKSTNEGQDQGLGQHLQDFQHRPA